MDKANSDLANKLTTIAEKHQLLETVERIRAIDSAGIKIKVAFLGEFNSGKTTLINALLKKKLLPMFDTPTTAAITEISKSDTNEAFVLTVDEEGNEVKSPIDFYELAGHISASGPDKRIGVNLADSEFLDDTVLLIDTPGVSSINEIHTDITYGYLPSVDVAILILNPRLGDVPATLLDFLKQFPDDLLEKIYFVISRIDQVPDSTSNHVKNKIYHSLTQLVEHPKLMLVSGRSALEAINDPAAYQQSGIHQLISIIKEEVPLQKASVEAKRIHEMLRKEKDTIISLLKVKQNSLDWNTEEFDKTIREVRAEMQKLEQDRLQFRESFRELKRKNTTEISKTVLDYTDAIAQRLIEKEPYDELLHDMLDQVKRKIETGIQRLMNIQFSSIDLNLATLLKPHINKETSTILDTAHLLTDAVTFAVTIWVAPGSSAAVELGEFIAGATVIATQEAGNTGNPHGTRKGILNAIGKTARAAGKLVKELNPFEKIKKGILPYVIQPKLSKSLIRKVTENVNAVYELIEESLNNEIQQKYEIPLHGKEEILIQTKKLKKEHLSQIESLKESVTADITFLELMD
ncbi:dynamin family protein [Dyadobacter fanqingshengii]|uniref:Dynamin family protein n=1 Tax=Dyadobacter fanqingshengii TaxID=2906443 RepID=A0A9X1P6P0_9BACT|nr:dynamin family protein [Dyadobacter fanqingshengii]MCF0039736.1 dynamin family protein [Dyadobacter fanqingshengii]USJ38502.1 dynamin family protein [Dyadobacter fanqingshengii]